MSEPHPSKTDNGKDLKSIEQQLEEVNPELFDGIPETKKTEILRVFSFQTKITKHSGPLPSPEDLGKYAKVIPEGADRIMCMAELQQKHRMELEKKAIKEQFLQSKLGQIFGLLIGLSAIIGGVVCIMNNHEWSGAFLGGSGLTGLVSVFVIGRAKQNKIHEERLN